MLKVIATICILLNLLVFDSLQAQNTPPADSQGIDAVLLLDSSGSMRITDPLRLRNDATRLFTQFLRSADRLAIFEFSDDVKLLRPLVEYNTAQDPEVAQVINSISDTGEHTDLYTGIKSAWELLKSNPRPDSEQVIILLSDGKMEPAQNKGSVQVFTERLLDELLPELRSQNVKVYTLAFSELADKDLLAQVSGITTAVHWFTPSSEKIHESFADLFLTVKKPQMLPLTSRGFKIDKDIQEATFYINREQGEEVTLTSPEGTRITSASKISGIKWFKGELFDVITIDLPEAGQWQLTGLAKNSGFATLLTNLKLTTNWPAAITAGEDVTLEARLYEYNKPVALPDMSDAISYAFQVTPTDKVSGPIIRSALNDEGKDGDRIASDGVFSSKVSIAEEGEYRLQVVASAPTFERRQQVSFRVKPPLVRVKVVSSEEALSHKSDGDTAVAEDYFRIELSPELLTAKNIEVEFLATNKDRSLFKLPLTRIDNAFEVPASKLPADGEYSVRAKLSAEGRRGKGIHADSQTINYVKLAKVKDEDTLEVIVVEEEKVVEPIIVPSFPWLYFILLILLNSGLGFAALQFLKSQNLQAGSSEVGAVFLDVAAFEGKINELEKISQLSEVDLDDPDLFSDTQEYMEPASDPQTSLEQETEELESTEPSEEQTESDSQELEDTEANNEENKKEE